MTVTFHPAIDYPPDTLVDLLNQGFADYVVNVQFERATLLSILTRDSVDLGLSRVAADQENPVGIALIARRGWSARLAAMCVAPDFRGRGVGTALLNNIEESLTAHNIGQFQLEVVEQNGAAAQLYKRVGFQTIRRLVSLSADSYTAVDEPPQLEEVDIATVATLVTAHPLSDLPWQLSGTSIMVSGSPSRAYHQNGGYIVISDPAQPSLSVRSLYVPPGQRRKGLGTALLRSILACLPGKKWSIPPVCPEEISDLFTRNGFQIERLSQLQMKKKLPDQSR